MARKIPPKYRRRKGKHKVVRDPSLPPLAAIYINRPDEARDALGLTRATSRLFSFCTGRGWLFSEDSVYVEDGKARDHSPLVRPAFSAMMNGVKSGKYQCVVSISFFEISRDLYTLCAAVEDMTKSGCTFASIQESVDTGTPLGRFVLTALAVCADYYEAIKMEEGETNEVNTGE